LFACISCTLPSVVFMTHWKWFSKCRNMWEFSCNIEHWGRSQWPRSLRCGTAAARFTGLRVWIPLGAWMCVSCKCCVLLETSASGWSLVYRSPTEYGVSVCNLEGLAMRRSCPPAGCHTMEKIDYKDFFLDTMYFVGWLIKKLNSEGIKHICRKWEESRKRV